VTAVDEGQIERAAEPGEVERGRIGEDLPDLAFIRRVLELSSLLLVGQKIESFATTPHSNRHTNQAIPPMA